MTLWLALVSLPLQAYVWLRVIRSGIELTKWKASRLRLIALAGVVLVLLYPLSLLLSYLFKLDGGLRALQQPGGVTSAVLLYAFWLGIAFITQLAILFVVVDVLLFIASKVPNKRGIQWARVKAWTVIGLFGAALIYVPARVYNDTWTVRVKEKEVRVPNLPPELDGFHIIHIADLQADARTDGGKLQRYVDAVNGLDPDLVCFSGDLVTSGTDYIETGAQALAKMNARYGVYACIGDHDIFSNRAQVVSSLRANGVKVLDNAAAGIAVQGSLVSLTGVTNAYADRPSNSELAAMEGRRQKGAVNIFLTHQPSEALVRYAEQEGYDVLLGGHTHGGQVVFPLPGFLLTGSSFETRYVTGFYEAGRMLVSINNGLGMTLAPIRYHAPAEVTSVRLKKGD
jgi:predicted MPP superfamily phosphohydrolase